MAKFTTYAEVLTPEHVQMKAFVSGVKKNMPGITLHELLQWTNGVYEKPLQLSPRIRENLRKVGELTSDTELLRLARLDEVTIPFGHLRNMAPETRIVLGYRLMYEPGESERLGLKGDLNPDLRTTFSSDET